MSISKRDSEDSLELIAESFGGGSLSVHWRRFWFWHLQILLEILLLRPQKSSWWFSYFASFLWLSVLFGHIEIDNSTHRTFCKLFSLFFILYSPSLTKILFQMVFCWNFDFDFIAYIHKWRYKSRWRRWICCFCLLYSVECYRLYFREFLPFQVQK